jgi:TIR domain
LTRYISSAEYFVKQLKALRARVRIFLSYRRTNKEYAHLIASALKSAFPNAIIYIDTDAGTPGEDFQIRLRREILLADLLVVAVTPGLFTSFEKKDATDYVADEVETAFQLGVPILPVLEKSEDFPMTNSIPTRIRTFARINATISSRLDDGNIDYLQLRTRATSALSRSQQYSLKTKRGAAFIVAIGILDVLVRPSRFAATNATTRTQALLSGSALLLVALLLSSLASGLFANDDVWIVLRVVMESASTLIAATLAFTALSSLGWLVLRRSPEVSLIFVATCASLFALWVTFLVQTLLAFVAFNLAGMNGETIREVLRLTEMSYADFVRNFYDAMSPSGFAVLLLAQIIFFGLSILYFFDNQRFQCVIHLADTRNATKWRLFMLFAITSIALFLFALPASANETQFSCAPNSKASERTNLCLRLQHRSDDSKHPGNIDLRVYGEVSHTLKALKFKIKGVQVLSSHKSAGGLIRVNKIDIAFAPFLKQSGIGKIVDVTYKWKNNGVGKGSVPIDVLIDGSVDQRAAVNQMLELPLPINYAEGAKRALFTVWIDFHHPNGGFSASGWPLYCEYESGSCLSN